MSEIGPESLFMAGSKRRGRPKAEEPLSTVSTRLTIAQHDLLIRVANQREQSVSATLRQIIDRSLRRTS